VKRWIKIFAIWLIAIAIPVQGVASVAMINCAQSPHQYQQELAKHQHDMQHDHVTEHAHSHDTAKVDGQITQGKLNTKHACAHCVKCTNCCSGFTFQSTASSLFQQLPVIQARLNDLTLLFTGFIPSGLERPPRPSLV
jgi:ABC-type nickel/cobalt efflux system permease component RcnA